MSHDVFTQLVDAHYTPLYRFALSLARREADACDLVQQTFFIWAKSGHQLRETGKAKTWLFTTLYQEFLRGRRRDLRSQAIEDLPPSAQDVPIGTVMSRLSRGKVQLRKLIARKEASQSGAGGGVVKFPKMKQGGGEPMTNEEAKFMLQGYRPNGDDAKNEAFAEALSQANRDPSLREWFEHEQAFDQVIAGKLRGIAAPDGLRESILAGTKLSSTRPMSWWRNPWMMGSMAAAAAVALVATVFWAPTKEAQVAGSTGLGAELILQTALAEFHGDHPIGLHANDLGNFGAWLEASSTHLSRGVMPVTVSELRQDGCRSVELAGLEMFEICFQRDGNWYHVYLSPRDGFAPESVHEEPMFHEQGEFVAATWADAAYVYLVSGAAGVESLREIL
ncbi:MAG: RNA polymerase sigma factor [Candidatus Synoicihabitans palmerolidicus]|nr:RNA polymerase sigma factor [Candidatus Synoicihabitans palmerolidicus]